MAQLNEAFEDEKQVAKRNESLHSAEEGSESASSTKVYSLFNIFVT